MIVKLMHILYMGGYGAYVWSAYALVVAVLIGNLYLIKRRVLRTQSLLRRWFRNETRT